MLRPLLDGVGWQHARRQNYNDGALPGIRLVCADSQNGQHLDHLTTTPSPFLSTLKPSAFPTVNGERAAAGATATKPLQHKLGAGAPERNQQDLVVQVYEDMLLAIQEENTHLSNQLREANDRIWDAEARAHLAEEGACLAEERARTAEQTTTEVTNELRAANRRVWAAEDRTQAAEEKARTAEDARTRLVEEAATRAADAAAASAAATAAAAAAAVLSPPMHTPSAQQNDAALAEVRNFVNFLDPGGDWQPSQMRSAHLAQLRDECDELERKLVEGQLKLRAAESALQPGSGLLGGEDYIGQGSFGAVTKAWCELTSSTWAIKRAETVEAKAYLVQEMRMYLSISRSEHILDVLSVDDSGLSMAIALECGQSDMAAAMAKDMISLPGLFDVLTDVAEGLKHCHDHHVVVCDVKPENVILVHDGTRYVGKVADFGLAMEAGRTRQAGIGTPGFIAPEATASTTLAEPSTDVFSLGAVLAMVVLKPFLRQHNVFASEIFQSKEETRELCYLAQHDVDRYHHLVATITHRTMLDESLAKKAIRPIYLNRMPGSAMTIIRMLVRTMTLKDFTKRPTMEAIAGELATVASHLRLMEERSASTDSKAAAQQPLSSGGNSSTPGGNSSAPGGNSLEVMLPVGGGGSAAAPVDYSVGSDSLLPEAGGGSASSPSIGEVGGFIASGAGEARVDEGGGGEEVGGHSGEAVGGEDDRGEVARGVGRQEAEAEEERGEEQYSGWKWGWDLVVGDAASEEYGKCAAIGFGTYVEAGEGRLEAPG